MSRFIRAAAITTTVALAALLGCSTAEVESPRQSLGGATCGNPVDQSSSNKFYCNINSNHLGPNITGLWRKWAFGGLMSSTGERTYYSMVAFRPSTSTPWSVGPGQKFIYFVPGIGLYNGHHAMMEAMALISQQTGKIVLYLAPLSDGNEANTVDVAAPWTWTFPTDHVKARISDMTITNYSLRGSHFLQTSAPVDGRCPAGTTKRKRGTSPGEYLVASTSDLCESNLLYKDTSTWYGSAGRTIVDGLYSSYGWLIDPSAKAVVVAHSGGGPRILQALVNVNSIPDVYGDNRYESFHSRVDSVVTVNSPLGGVMDANVNDDTLEFSTGWIRQFIHNHYNDSKLDGINWYPIAMSTFNIANSDKPLAYGNYLGAVMIPDTYQKCIGSGSTKVCATAHIDGLDGFKNWCGSTHHLGDGVIPFESQHSWLRNTRVRYTQPTCLADSVVGFNGTAGAWTIVQPPDSSDNSVRFVKGTLYDIPGQRMMPDKDFNVTFFGDHKWAFAGPVREFFDANGNPTNGPLGTAPDPHNDKHWRRGTFGEPSGAPNTPARGKSGLMDTLIPTIRDAIARL